MLSKSFLLAGCFLIGAGLTGLISYTALIFPELRFWGVWVMIVVFGILAIACLTDDWICQYFEISYHQFIAFLIGISIVLILGGFIQWQ